MEETIDLRELIAILLKGKWIIAVTTVAAILCAFIVSWFVLKNEYQATATIEIAKLGANDSNDKLKQIILSELTTENFKQSFTDNSVLEEGLQQQQYDSFNVGNLTITQQPNTTVFDVSYTGLNADDVTKYLQLSIDSVVKSFEKVMNDSLIELKEDYQVKTAALSDSLAVTLSEYNKLITQHNLPNTFLIQPLMYEGSLAISDTQVNALSALNTEVQLKLIELTGEITALKNQFVDMKELEKAATIGVESIDLTQYIKVENTRVEDPAVLAPNKKLNLVIGAVMGLILGIFIVVFLDYWRNSTKSV